MLGAGFAALHCDGDCIGRPIRRSASSLRPGERDNLKCQKALEAFVIGGVGGGGSWASWVICG